MRVQALAQQMRVFLVTFLTGLTITTLALLVLHYGLSASEKDAENRELKAQVRSLVERLAEVETVMLQMNEQRKNLDDMTLAAVTSVLGTAEINPETQGKVYMATLSEEERMGLPKKVPMKGEAFGITYTDAVSKVEVIKQKASLLMRDLSATGATVALRQDVLNAIPSLMPAKGWISSDYGMRVSPFHGSENRMHNGIDVAADEGSPVYATADGVVAFAGKFGGYGNYVRINHGFGIQTRYAHNADVLVKKGQKVKRGDQIAVIGNTGRSTGPHVHYEVLIHEKPIDPARFFFDSKPAQQPVVSFVGGNRPRPMGGEIETAESAESTALEATETSKTLEATETTAAVKAEGQGAFRLLDLAGEPLVFAAALPAPLRRATTSDVMMLAAVLIMLTVASSLVRMPEQRLARIQAKRSSYEPSARDERRASVGRLSVWAGQSVDEDDDAA